MKKLIILLTVFIGLTSCSVKEKPEFIGVKNMKVVNATSKYVHIKAEALFKNPNDIGGKLLTDGIKVLVNDVEMATIVSEEFKVPAKKAFAIPLQAKVPVKKLLSTNKNATECLLIKYLYKVITRQPYEQLTLKYFCQHKKSLLKNKLIMMNINSCKVNFSSNKVALSSLKGSFQFIESFEVGSS